jgi:hypothetical protein
LNNKINGKAQRLGFCCEYAMLTAYSGYTRAQVSRKTRLSERTVWYSYAKLAQGKIKCLGSENTVDCLVELSTK